MITLAFLLDHQVISRSDKNTVVAGSKNYVRARFILRTDDWTRPITAIFGGYTQLLDDNNECTVPWEVLQQLGNVEVSAFCGDLHTANIAVVPVEKTGYKSGETPKDPTPDVYDQLAKMVQEAVDTANSVREDADAGDFDGEQGPAGPQGDPGPQGNPGPQGEPGQDGAAATIQVGQVTTLPAGQQATVTNVGTANAARFDFGIPKGQDGKDGTPGQDGKDGKDGQPGADGENGGYYIPSMDDIGNLGFEPSRPGMPPVAGANIRGPQGPKGDPGLGVPSPTQADAGKVPTVKADGSAYELAGPYAPLSAAIRPTASGNPVSITDSVEWPLLGLKVYGKSTQVTTTGASLANPADFSADERFIYLIQQNPFEIKPGESYSFTFYNDDSVEHAVQVELRENGSNNLIDVAYTNTLSYTNHDETHHVVYFRVYLYESAVPASYRIMLNAGPTALPWEPYTGGKPSPSPEYPQPIVSAGGGGSIALTVSDGADQSQSLTISTPTGLSGIPVDSGGNYTDTSGKRRWVDVIDYSNEKKYQYINKVVVDGTNVKFTSGSGGQFWNLPHYSVPSIAGISSAQISKYFPKGLFSSNSSYDFIFTTPNQMAPYFETVEELNAFCVQKNTEGNPLTIMYVMETPIETPLSDEELTAYRALHTYDGTTVVSTAEDVAGLEVKYLADGEKYVERIVSQKASEAAAAHTMALLADGIREGVNGV